MARKYRMANAVLVIGILSITLLLWVNRISERERIDSLLTEALMDVQIHCATAHLWLEQAVSGDSAIDVDKKVLAELDQAIALARSTLEGGPSEHGLIEVPFEEPAQRDEAEAVRSMVASFRVMSLERLGDPVHEGVASAADRHYDALFNAIIARARLLETQIEQRRTRSRVSSDRLFLGILVVWSTIVVVAAAGLRGREKRRQLAEESLRRANETLRSQAEELDGHRERLEELVRMRTFELTAANDLLMMENGERRRMEDEIRRMNESLERTIAQRTRELLEAQEELVRREKLALMGQLAGSVGHELRNPLAVMNNAVYFLKLVLPDAAPVVQEYLALIGGEIDKSQRIITDLLDFARTRAPEVRPVAARELTGQCLERCTIPDNIEVRHEVPDSLSPLNVDQLQMGQVLENLVANAVQAMPEGGRLRIGAYHVPPPADLERAGDFVAICVADSGEGIPPENVAKVFQPLFTTKAKGIGLGLVVCKTLTEANGGRIEVESTVGAGSVFTLLLPAGGDAA